MCVDLRCTEFKVYRVEGQVARGRIRDLVVGMFFFLRLLSSVAYRRAWIHHARVRAMGWGGFGENCLCCHSMCAPSLARARGHGPCTRVGKEEMLGRRRCCWCCNQGTTPPRTVPALAQKVMVGQPVRCNDAAMRAADIFADGSVLASLGACLGWRLPQTGLMHKCHRRVMIEDKS